MATSQQLRSANIPALLKEIRPHIHEYADITRSIPVSKGGTLENDISP